MSEELRMYLWNEKIPSRLSVTRSWEKGSMKKFNFLTNRIQNKTIIIIKKTKYEFIFVATAKGAALEHGNLALWNKIQVKRPK